MSVALPARAVLLPVFDDQDSRQLADLGDGAGDRSLRNVRHADGGIFAVIYEQNLVENDLVALIVGIRKLLNGDDISLCDRILLAAGGDDCEFHSGTYYT